ncbi:ABC transporter substrate-binding protein [Paracoccus laeviglucosivorans]|uniref:Amino acid/amide ABC transporter substrate-binding protein, HAAT family n=1 Tax=Paracoccus laeviglucosivorans TaxID=1197861 RepID=A0A521FBU2_9RHOB|nr:ABC transporter substrate-binding protein [Paracoccus laeviglucosivorans]SMO93635.1 amino acid/amide ABC transporter substrate-binding protein, HAAT family [Paracoccus laeviglucosivorans]
MKALRMAAVCLTALGLTMAHAAPALTDEILIGELHPLTGPASFYGIPESRGIQLAVEEINAAGGVRVGDQSQMLRLMTEDDHSTPTAGVAALKKLRAADVRFIIGPLGSGVAPALFPIIDRDSGVTQIVDGTIAEGVTNGRNIFRNQAAVSQYDLAVADLFRSKKYASVAMMTDRFHAGFMGTQPALSETLKSLNATVAAEEYYKLGDTDFSAAMTKLVSLQPEVLLIRGYPAEGALITRQARQLGYEGQVVWEMVSPPSTVLKNISATEMEGVYNCIPPTTEDYIALGQDKALAFDKAYQAKFGTTPGELSTLSYDAVYILKAAFEKAGSTENEAVNAALAAMRPEDVPQLISGYVAHQDGRLFDDVGQVNLRGAVSIWQGEGWVPVPDLAG